LDPRENKTAI
jgi:hypothetical protein